MTACPICETQNPPGSLECGGCGKIFSQRAVEASVVPVEGLEQTRFARAAEAGIERLPEVERTQLAERDLAVQADTSVPVERTQLSADPAAPSFWSPDALALDRGREEDDGVRTLDVPDGEICPYCGAQSPDAVCDGCGRRKARYARVPERAPAPSSNETVLCPACFAKVPGGPRCIECGVPFAGREP